MTEQFFTKMDALVPYGRLLALIELGDDRIPDEPTVLNFLLLLEHRRLIEILFADVNVHLVDKDITLRSGTLVYLSWRTPSGRVSLRKITEAPTSVSNKDGLRDSEMSSTKKGNIWYFGMKTHVGVNAESGITHSFENSTVKLQDSQIWSQLLHGEETTVWADKGYVSAGREAVFKGPKPPDWGRPGPQCEKPQYSLKSSLKKRIS